MANTLVVEEGDAFEQLEEEDSAAGLGQRRSRDGAEGCVQQWGKYDALVDDVTCESGIPRVAQQVLDPFLGTLTQATSRIDVLTISIGLRHGCRRVWKGLAMPGCVIFEMRSAMVISCSILLALNLVFSSCFAAASRPSAACVTI